MEDERKQTLIVVFIAETDKNFVHELAREIRLNFIEHLASGLIEIIAPAASYYHPRVDNLKLTLNDSIERVRWRSKEVLDAAFLMSYVREKSEYFLMVQDDVVSKQNYFSDIKDFLENSNEQTLKNPWKILKISKAGAVATLYRSSDLTDIVAFLNIFYNDKPVDWLIEEFLNTKFCIPQSKADDCEKIKSKIRLTKSSQVFMHVGRISSLKGKKGQEINWHPQMKNNF
jgi:alpha-1,3-mannosylglycoprotein beta-1,4-N-acetylglucosaminyltransferase A/B